MITRERAVREEEIEENDRSIRGMLSVRIWKHQSGGLQERYSLKKPSWEESTEWKPGREKDQVKDVKGENIIRIKGITEVMSGKKTRKGTDLRDEKEKKEMT